MREVESSQGRALKEPDLFKRRKKKFLGREERRGSY